MTDKPKPSRMERQVRSQISGLSLVAWALLLGCMAMTAMFGWGLGRSLADKIIFAGSLMAIDLGGALAMKSSGTFSANGEGKGVFWSSIAAAICAAITFLGMLGFQSESREAQVSAREQSAKIAASHLAWAKDMAVDATLAGQPTAKGKDAPKDKAVSAALTMTAGIEAVGKVVRDQIGMLQSGELVVTGDGQGAALSRLSFGTLSEAQARSWVMTAISAAFLAVQYLFQWLAGYMRYRVEPVVAALAGASETGSVSKITKVGKFAYSANFEAARRDAVKMIVTGVPFPTNAELGQRWGVSSTQAHHYLQALRDEGHDIPIRQRGGKRTRRLNGSAHVDSGESFAPALNGNGRAHVT